MVSLKNKNIAIFIEDFYEDMEFWYPYFRMKEEEAEVVVIGPEIKSYKGKKGMPATTDRTIQEVDPTDFDALIIPGGYSPDRMRRVPEMVEFVQKMNEQNNVIAAICHAPWMLASANIIEGKKMTSFFSIKDDMVNAGANWIDEEVIKDGNIISSRNPGDLPAFCKAIINSLS